MDTLGTKIIALIGEGGGEIYKVRTGSDVLISSVLNYEVFFGKGSTV